MTEVKSAMYFIINPMAGSGKTYHYWKPAEALLVNSAVTFSKVHTQCAGHAVELAYNAADEGYRTIFAVGGDGTLHEVVQGICDWCDKNAISTEEFRVGVIPVGSGNDWIKSLNVPHDTVKVAQMILSEQYVPIDVVRVRDSSGKNCYMSNIGGVGFDSHVCEVVNRQKEKGYRSRFMYFIGLMRTIAKLNVLNLRVKADGTEVYRGMVYSIALGNGCYSGSGMRQVPLARINDGILDYTIVPRLGLMTILGEIPKLFSGKLDQSSAVICGKCERLEIEPLDAASADLFEVDGEVVTKLPVTVEVTGRSINALGSISEEPARAGL